MRKKIYVSLEGYLSDCRKTAVCLTSNNTFSLIDEKTEKAVFSGNLTESAFDEDSGDEIRIADFTRFTGNGKFHIKCGYRHSDSFEINDNVYAPLKRKCLDGIFLNRCGYDLSSRRLGVSEEFLHRKCHTDLTPLYFGEKMLDVTGGWHDCTYGKFVTVTAQTCAAMLYSLMLYPKSFSDGEYSLAEECRWGLEWLLKMQAENGGVYHKADGVGIPSDPAPPCEDKDEKYVFPFSYDATMFFTAAAALGARVFENIDSAFAKRLRQGATNGWLWIVNCAGYEPWKLPSGALFGGLGDIEITSYKEVYMWMISEMFALTGDELFFQKFNELVFSEDITSFTLDNTGGFAALAYMTSGEKKAAGTEFFIKKKFGDRADKIIFSSSKGYGTALGSKKCAFGGYGRMSNMMVISDAIICQAAYMIFGIERYRTYSADILGYVFGRNPMGISYISGGENSPMRMAHSLSVAARTGSVPGMIVNGANMDRFDDYSKWRLPSKTPPAKCYLDNEFSYSTNFPSIAFGALMIMAAAFYDENGITDDKISFTLNDIKN